MKKLVCSIALSAIVLAGCNHEKKEEKPAEPQMKLDTVLSKVSYGIGLNIATNFKDQNIDIDQVAFQQGLQDGFTGAEAKLDQKAIMEAMQTFQKEQMEKQLAEREASAKANKVESDAYLTENAKKDGVKTTESGLQYKVITAGSGDKPTPEDTVTVHYKGTLVNGEEFDSSYSRGEPATFKVTNVIPGWTEALQMMSPGAKYEIAIPANLAYGEAGAGAKIGPDQALLFEVELIEIVKPEAQAEAAK